MAEKEKTPLFANPLEPIWGLSISDLNLYLPAIQTAKDIKITAEEMREGLFLTDGLSGLSQLPADSIDLIIADPPENPWRGIREKGASFTLQEMYQWNNDWLKESFRVLKTTGAIYLFCSWRFSGMYHALLNDNLIVQCRITWRNSAAEDQPRAKIWRNSITDIWFATKSNEFLFDQKAVGQVALDENHERNISSNFWGDILSIPVKTPEIPTGDKPSLVIDRILDASSYKLNWVLDPFMHNGGVGVQAKQKGRRFIGFESDQDRLLLAMKRIDQT